jgi:hypothetical protein
MSLNNSGSLACTIDRFPGAPENTRRDHRYMAGRRRLAVPVTDGRRSLRSQERA